MKYIKLFMLAVVATLFVACSDDDSFNSNNDVTVGFEAAEQTYNESDNMIYVPVKVSGERNGDVKIKVEAVDGSAKDGTHYMVTSGDINIPGDSEEDVVNIEVLVYDDGTEENDDREFTLNIVDANGATVSISSCVVTLKDVDKNPYFKLFGTYTVEAIDVATETPVTFDLVINDDADAASAEKYLYGEGAPSHWFGFDSKWILEYHPDGTLQFSTDGYWDGLYNFGSFKGAVSVLPYHVVGGKLTPCNDGQGPKAVYNDTFDTIEFVDDCYLSTAVWSYNGGFEAYKGYYDDYIYVTKLTKK